MALLCLLYHVVEVVDLKLHRIEGAYGEPSRARPIPPLYADAQGQRGVLKVFDMYGQRNAAAWENK